MSTTTNTDDDILNEAKQRTEWLSEFHDATWTARATLQSMDGLIEACYRVGNEKLGDTLGEYSDVLREAVEKMNNSVSRMIQEDADASFDQIGKTFRALLEVTTSTPPGREDGEDDHG